MRLLLVDDELCPERPHPTRIWDGACHIQPIRWLAQLRDADAAELDGIVMGPRVTPVMLREALRKCANHKLPLVLLGPWNERLLRHVRSRHPLVVHLPEEHVKTPSGDQLSAAVDAVRQDRHRPRALVVVANPTLRTVVRTMLEGDGFKPEAHADLASAREATRTKGSPDVSVVDVFLPDGNGLTILPAKGAPIGAPVILLSPTRERWIVEEARRRGAQAVLRTPLDPARLSEQLVNVSRNASRLGARP